MAVFFSALLAIIAGACITIQAPVNAALARGLGMPFAAACVSFLAGAIALGIATAVSAQLEGRWPAFSVPQPWLFVAGGLLGTVYVTTAILLTPRIGAAAVMAFAVTGQLIAGIIVDRIGLLGIAVREISLGRITGALLLIAGAVLIRVT